MIRQLFLCLAVIALGGVLVVSCATPPVPPSATATVVPATAVSTAATTVPPTASSAPPTSIPPTTTRAPATTVPTAPAGTPAASNATGKIDINALLPAGTGNGRELVLQYCTNCHNIAPMAIAHKTKDEWYYVFYVDHVNRAPISKADYDTIFNYFVDNYPPDRKIPDLPPELLQDWTSY
jgi:hypothetical protein